jgi:hypothetical protein
VVCQLVVVFTVLSMVQDAFVSVRAVFHLVLLVTAEMQLVLAQSFVLGPDLLSQLAKRTLVDNLIQIKV